MAATFLSQPVSGPEAAWSLLKYKTAYWSSPHGKENELKFSGYLFADHPGNKKTKMGGRGAFAKANTRSPVQIYMDRPVDQDRSLYRMTFDEYFNSFIINTSPSSDDLKKARALNAVPEPPCACGAVNGPPGARCSCTPLPRVLMDCHNAILTDVRGPGNRNYIVTSTDPCPKKDPQGEAFFYREFLRKVPFTSELEMLSPVNTMKSYFVELCLRGIIKTVGCIKNMLRTYQRRNLKDTKTYDENVMLAVVQSAYPHLKDVDLDDDDSPIPPPPEGAEPVEPTAAVDVKQFYDEQRNEFDGCFDGCQLPEGQQHALQRLMTEKGLFFLTGGAGVGKSYVGKLFAHLSRQAGKNVLVCASTGIAARRFSKYGDTVHHTFGLSAERGTNLPDFAKDNPQYQLLAAADVIIIDEISMLELHTCFQHVMTRLTRLKPGCTSMSVALENKTVLMIGDLCQLPPICDHTRGQYESIEDSEDPNDTRELPVCYLCHPTKSPNWEHNVKGLVLTEVMRQSEDPAFAEFLNRARLEQLPQHVIDAVLGSRYITPEKAMELLRTTAGSEPWAILCSHRKDMARYNAMMLRLLFPEEAIVQLPMKLSEDCHRMDEPMEDPPKKGAPGKATRDQYKGWLARERFYSLPEVAIGARVLVTKGKDTPGDYIPGSRKRRKGKVPNGAIGTVTAIERDAQSGEPSKLVVKVDDWPHLVTFSRTMTHTLPVNGFRFRKATFQLQLAYAFTVHKSQGMTIPHKVIIHARHFFSRGMTYVALSRATKLSNLYIVGRINAATFQPVPEELRVIYR